MIKVAIDISPTLSAHRFRGIGFYTQQLAAALKDLKEPGLEVSLVKEAKLAEKADIIHYPYFDLFKPTLPLVKKGKTVVTIHDVTPLLFPEHFPPGIKGRLNHFLQGLSLKNVSLVITDSHNSKKDLVKYLHLPQEKIKVVYLAPRRIFKKLKKGSWQKKITEKYHLPKEFILYVGDVNYHKNVLGLARACQMIKKPLVIAGKQAAEVDFDRTHVENQPLLQLINEFGQNPGVIRLGFVSDDDLVALYNSAAVYCQPSFYEGFGLSVLEAMACGIPTVVAKTGSLPEISGQAALMVDPCRTDGLAQGLKKVLTNDKLSKELSERGIENAQKFTWQKTAQKTLSVYQRVNER